MFSIDRSMGRAQIIGGKLVYSPNCHRDVSIPHTSNLNLNDNIFLPPLNTTSLVNGGTARQYNFSTIHLKAYQNPRWWSRLWGWTSFIPTRPFFYGYIFGVLAHLPRPDQLCENPSQPDSVSYSLPKSVVNGWERLETDIYRVIHHLCLFTNTNLLKPVLPWVFGYKKSFASRTKAMYAIKRSRDWFAVWMGLLSFLLAKAKTLSSSWNDYLISTCCEPAWLDDFILPSDHTSITGETAGVFLDISDSGSDDTQPSVEWLCHFGIPVWYIWSTENEKNPALEHLSPLAHQLQSISTSIIPQPSSLTIPHRPTWQEFFAKREERNKLFLKNETAQLRQARENRERIPPTTSAKVFIWVEDMSGHFVREPVSRRERLDTLAFFSTDEIRYDAFSNEYDCCEEFGSGTGHDLDCGGEDFEEEISVEEIEKSPKVVPETDVPKLSLCIQGEISSAFDADWAFNHAIEETTTDKAENEILDILRLYFGYTPPLPPSSLSPISEESQQKNFLKILGIPWKTCPLDVFRRPRIQAGFSFIRCLCQKMAIRADEWDYDRNHQETIVLNARIKSIQQVQETSATSSKSLFMFDFGGHMTMKWKLAVTCAADAVLICRLNSQHSEVEIALFLLQRGIPFHTLLQSSVLPQTQSQERLREHPFRPANYTFDATDYAIYIERSTELLKGPLGRVALMKGGYLWRLAVSVVSFDAVLNGPVGQSKDYLKVMTDGGETYVDNLLTQAEMDILAGLYQCSTGDGTQIAKKSWYPLVQAYEHSGQDYGRWTANSETIFNIFESRVASGPTNTVLLQRQPISANKWRDALRGSGDLRRIKALLEKTSLELIASQK